MRPFSNRWDLQDHQNHSDILSVARHWGQQKRTDIGIVLADNYVCKFFYFWDNASMEIPDWHLDDNQENEEVFIIQVEDDGNYDVYFVEPKEGHDLVLVR